MAADAMRGLGRRVKLSLKVNASLKGQSPAMAHLYLRLLTVTTVKPPSDQPQIQAVSTSFNVF